METKLKVGHPTRQGTLKMIAARFPEGSDINSVLYILTPAQRAQALLDAVKAERAKRINEAIG